MSTISACKANLTKALSALETTEGKIPQNLVDPFENVGMSPAITCELLDQRQGALRSHLTSMKAALRTMQERKQAFLDFVNKSTNLEADNKAYTEYMQENKVEDVLLVAENLIRTLHENLVDALSQLEALRVSTAASPHDENNSHHGGQRRQSPPSHARPSVAQVLSEGVSPYSAADTNSAALMSSQVTNHSAIQLGKLNLEPFTGDITQFQRFWCAFELAVHNDVTISTTFKFLYLQSLLKGDAQIVLQDLDPDECNYYELVQALKKRYDRPHKTRAMLHRQLQHLPPASNTGSDLRNTWFRISGILRGLRKYEDFRTVLPILDLVKVRRRFRSAPNHAYLDNIIASKEKYEDTTTLRDSYSVNNSFTHHQTRSRSQSPQYDTTKCAFCGTRRHKTRDCSVTLPVDARINIARIYNLCWRCLKQGHSHRSCQYPACRRCSGDHHDLLCRTRSRSEKTRRSPNRHDHHRSRRHDYERKRHEYRSPSRDRYSSRSPFNESLRRRKYSDSEHSRSPSSNRYYGRDSQRTYSPIRQQSRSPNRVTFKSPVRNRTQCGSYREARSSRRASSPHPAAFQYQEQDSDAEFEQLNHCYQSRSSKRASVKTALMLVTAKACNYKGTSFAKVTLLLDSGAQNSFITTSTVHRLGLPIYNKKPRTFVTFGGHENTEVTGIVDVTLVDSFDQTLTIHLTSKDTITLPQIPPQLSNVDIKFMKKKNLQIPSCNSSYPVLPDILIGIDNYWDVLLQEPPLCLPSEGPNTDGVFATHDADDDVAKRLWSLESLGIMDDHNPNADDELNAHILTRFYNTSKIIDGFLYVQFPWKISHPKLSDNKQLAYCRLVSQYQRFRQTPTAWKQYAEAIENHLVAGFIEEVDEHTYDSHRVYYIPHQAVYKESSSTTKLRIVFDASSKMKGAPSLNDCIHQGPTLLPELVGILLRARLRRFLLIADVEKAFHQIRLQRSQRDATRFLWLKDPFSPPSSDNLRIFRFTRVPFGVNASPFMLAAANQYYLRRFSSPLSKEIERNTYVDNVFLGASSSTEAISKYHAVKSTFTEMHMNLREFVCNSQVVNDSIPKQDSAVNTKRTLLLGIAWNYHDDTLHITIKTPDLKVHSRRTALRALASTYDPLGLFTPFLSHVKIFVQHLWSKKLAWDDRLDESDLRQWSDLIENLKHPLPPIPRLALARSPALSSTEYVCLEMHRNASTRAALILFDARRHLRHQD